MNILITGCAGFIGFHLSASLLKKNINVHGVDNINHYYSPKLKQLRLSILKKEKRFKFSKIDISDYKKLEKIFKKQKFDIIVNLAAQAGVRYSIINPKDYIHSNILGFFNILELSRINKIKKIFYASSSSVYGDHKKFPLKENEKLIPRNIYSFSKKNNEDIAKIYEETYGINLIGLRFFTVYGEWGRPDMLMMKYMMAKKNKKPFVLNHKGNHYRDFTYIQDVINLLTKLIFSKKKKKKIYNICSDKPVSVKKILSILNKLYGEPNIVHEKRLSIEVLKTHGSNKEIKKITKFYNFTNINNGILNLVVWAKKYLPQIN
jgi:UDP-glucuronate 4-epimerase